MTTQPETKRKWIIGALVTSWWNIWLERNKRVFENTSSDETMDANLITKDIDQRMLAFPSS